MTNNMKEFLSLASKDEAIQHELDALTSGGHDKIIAIAASHGITLTEDDFVQPEMQ